MSVLEISAAGTKMAEIGKYNDQVSLKVAYFWLVHKFPKNVQLTFGYVGGMGWYM